MPALTLEFEVYCSCGEGLCHLTKTSDDDRYHRGPSITVEACPKCIERAKSEGYDEGCEAAQT
jgi:hypothetical protein